MTWDQVATLGVPLLLVLLGIAGGIAKVYQSNAAVQKNQTLSNLLTFAAHVGTDAMALLRSNPGLTPAGVLSWAIQEFQATEPSLVQSAGLNDQPKKLENMVRRSFLDAAQSGVPDEAAARVVRDLAPTPLTAKVAPNQNAAANNGGPLSPAQIAEIDKRIAAAAMVPMRAGAGSPALAPKVPPAAGPSGGSPASPPNGSTTTGQQT